MAAPLPHAKRKFYDFPDTFETDTSSKSESESAKLLEYIEKNIVAKDKTFSGPFGLRKALYCDYTASGQSLGFIEDYIRKQVLTNYGNTHTTTSVTSLQTTLFRHEARDIIRNAVNASEHDAVIFAGSGCTSAVHKLIHAMNIQQPPVVFVGPYEHHSNLLPWKELGSTMVRIQQTSNGLVSISHLETELEKWKSSNRQLIGCFSAASNITGILTDVDSVTVTLHRHGALAYWDYATAGPHVDINMNPVMQGNHNARKDAIFISTHKFVGGVQTPGILVAKKVLFINPVPSNCGGGSVFYVRRDAHRYLQEVEMREEGGTPAIVESIRAGLVFQLKEAVTSKLIMLREDELCRQATQAWSGSPNIVLLGSTSVHRLPIFSFLIRHEKSGLFLHHNFVSALLNDMFGLQTRGGCACAGPYAQDLLGIDEVLSEKIEDILVEDSRLDRTHLRRYREYSDKEILRPGFVRLNLPFFMSKESVSFVLNAVKLVAEQGWKMLPQYIFNPETGEWRHRTHQVFKDRRWLGSVKYTTGQMTYPEPQAPVKGPLPANLEECLTKADSLFAEAGKSRRQLADQTVLFDEHAQSIRWFLLPSEAQHFLDPSVTNPSPPPPPFSPQTFEALGETIGDIEFQTRDDSTVNHEFGQEIKGGATKEKSELPLSKTMDYHSEDISDGNKLALNRQSDVFRDLQTTIENYVNDGFVGHEGDETKKDDAKDVDLGSGEKCKITNRNSCENMAGSDNDQYDTTGVGNKSTNVPVSKEALTTTVSNKNSKTLKDSDNEMVSDLAQKCNITHENTSCSKDSLENKAESTPACKLTSRVKSSPKQEQHSGKLTGDVNNIASCNGTEKSCRPLSKWCSPSKKIFKPTLEALEEYAMIQNGDRVLVCLSGGKDSLSLLHCMRQYQFVCKRKGIEFQLGAVTVDPQTSAYDPSPLKQYTASLGVPYFYEEQCILDTASNLPDGCASICSFCSRMKRGRIYACARREGYNVLAMGQHLDDLAESFLMSMFHNGALRTMKANYTVEEGDLRVIRPFVYVREKDLRNFAEQNRLPVIAENCPACFEAPKERHRTKQLLAAQEVLFPNLYNSMMAAMKPLMALDRTGVNVNKVIGQLKGDLEDGDL